MASTQEKATVSSPSRNASAAQFSSEWTAAGTVAEISDRSSTTRSAANAKTTATAAVAVIDSIDRPSLPNAPAVKGIGFHDLTNLLLCATHAKGDTSCSAFVRLWIV